MSNDWRPIESAPKDGRRVFVMRIFESHMAFAQRWAWWGRRTIRYSEVDPDTPDADFEGWLCDGDEGVRNCPTPTHWQPCAPERGVEFRRDIIRDADGLLRSETDSELRARILRLSAPQNDPEKRPE